MAIVSVNRLSWTINPGLRQLNALKIVCLVFWLKRITWTHFMLSNTRIRWKCLIFLRHAPNSKTGITKKYKTCNTAFKNNDFTKIRSSIDKGSLATISILSKMVNFTNIRTWEMTKRENWIVGTYWGQPTILESLLLSQYKAHVIRFQYTTM